MNQKFKPIVYFGILVIATVLLSYLSGEYIWKNKNKAEPPKIKYIVITEAMTLEDFAKANKLSKQTIKELFKIKNPNELKRPISDFVKNPDKKFLERVRKAAAIAAEHSSKNWLKIYTKFTLWFIMLAFAFWMMKTKRVNTNTRKILYLVSIMVFGVLLGSDPSPMGTVKDAIVLFAKEQVLFKPRMIALVLFLAMVVFANKFICAWGCQLGTLQDLIFRLNRQKNDRKPMILKQIKVPFVVSNTIRILFFILFTTVAAIWALDLIEFIDPFKVFKPQAMGIGIGIFVAIVLISSLFVYRPWCHFFCPFGLVGWLFEKISLYKIKVDYQKCTSCMLCEKSCPSNAMKSILRQETKTIPDCFSCGSCIQACPFDAISLSSGKREKPPAGKFEFLKK